MILGIFLLVIVASTLTYYLIYTSKPKTDGEVSVTVFINYGTLKEENQEEYNLTFPESKSALHVFLQIAELDLVNYTFGVYVEGVNGYTEEFPDYWAFYYYDPNTDLWVYSEIGVDHYYIEDGDKIKLEYTD